MSTVGRTTDNAEPGHKLAVRAAVAYLAAFWPQIVAHPEKSTESIRRDAGIGRTGYAGNVAQMIALDLSDSLASLGFSTPARISEATIADLINAVFAADAGRFTLEPRDRRELTNVLATFAADMHAIGVRAELDR